MMKKIIYLALFFLAASLITTDVAAQTIVNPATFPAKAAADGTEAIYTREDGVNRKVLLSVAKKYLTPNSQTTLISYTPTATGNTLNLMEIVKHTTTGEIWYIDSAGDAFKLNDPTEIMKNITVSQDSILIFYDQNGDEIDRDTIPLGTYAGGGGGSDDQIIDTFQLVSTTLRLSLENDGQATKEVDLSSLQDGTGTDDQTAAEVPNTPAGNIAATNVQAAINELDTEKLAASSYTASDVLAKLITVDGTGSNVDADLLDGQSSAAFGLVASPLSQFAATTSAQLAGVLSDESGSGGGFVRATSPTLVTPNLGTPSAATLTNATGLPIVAGTTGTLSVARGGTGLTSLGSALQVLRVNAGGTALEYAAASGGISGLTTNYIPKATSATTIGNSQIFDNGTNVGIGTTSPQAPLHVASTGIRIGNNGATSGWIFPFTNTAAGPVSTGLNISFYSYEQSATPNGAFAIQGSNLTATTGNNINLYVAKPFIPASGDATFSAINISTPINQSAGGTGITRGVYVSPFLTSVVDYRAFETNVDDANSYSIYASGALSKNYFAGNVGIANTSPAEKLDVTGNIRTSAQIQFGGSTNYMNMSGGDLFTVTASGAGIGLNAEGSTTELYLKSGNATIGGLTGVNKLNVTGAAVIGAGYVSTVAPTNGLLVEGNVGIGTTSAEGIIHAETTGAYQLLRSTNGTLSTRITLENTADDNDSWQVRRSASGEFVLGHSALQPYGTETKVIECTASEVRIIQDLVLDIAGNVRVMVGSGTPEAAVTAGVGSTFHRTDGGAGTSFYVKESGTGNTGWVAK